MNAKTLALFILFLAFGFIAKAEEIPGGIVYSDGKDAIYYDFGTKESKNLTSDLSEVVVKHPFAVSDNGKFLIWLQNSKFYVRELPTGTPNAVQVNKLAFKKVTKKISVSSSKNDIIEDIIWQGGEIKNMSLSPDGSRFAFDTIFQEPGWVFTGKNVYGEANTPNAGFYPFYAKRIDTYNGIFYLSTIFNKSDSRRQFSRPRYGNIVELPPALRFKASQQDLFGNRRMPYATEMTGLGGEAHNEKMVCYKRTIKKSAYYLAFQNSQNWEQRKKLAAFIYQIDNQWGPIELRVLDSKTQGGPDDEVRQSNAFYFGTESENPPENAQKCREWEILVSSKLCEGLFWKPDGSLTIQSGGDIYSIDALQIQEGVNNSGVKKEQKGNMVKFLPFNNVFTAKPKLIAPGINGACISWVSNDTFLFLGRDMIVYLWNQGKKEKASSSPILSEFYYCSKSPLANITVSKKTAVLATIPGSGKDRAIESFRGQTNNGKLASFNVGSIRTSWTGHNGNSVVIWIKESNKEKNGLKFVLPEESDLNKIKDPSQYEYQTQYEYRGSNVGVSTKTTFTPKEKVVSKLNVRVPLNEIIILKSGNDYAAIKPIGLEPRFKSPSDVPKDKSWQKSWGNWDWKKGPIPLYEWMTYEWKFWPSVRGSNNVVKIKTKTWEEALISKGWKISEAPISKEFEIGGVKFNWKLVEKKQGLPEVMKAGKTYHPSTKFSLAFQITDQTEDIGYFFDDTNTLDPSQYNFTKGKLKDCSWTGSVNYTIVFKIGNKYIAIKPLKNNGDSITYQWKLWSEVSPAELAKTALNK